jgi:hypothetical protein
MDKLITEKVDKTRDFLGGLLQLESRYSTICTKQFVELKDQLKDDYKKARDSW